MKYNYSKIFEIHEKFNGYNLNFQIFVTVISSCVTIRRVNRERALPTSYNQSQYILSYFFRAKFSKFPNYNFNLRLKFQRLQFEFSKFSDHYFQLRHDPYGKPGAGAPNKSQSGNDRRQVRTWHQQDYEPDNPLYVQGNGFHDDRVHDDHHHSNEGTVDIYW